MKTTYLCPRCRAILNVAGNVILSVKNDNGDWGLLLLHPSLGNYEVLHHENFILKEGEESHFHCPACHASLAFGGSNKLAEVIMCDENRNEFRIVFSQIKGEKSTYKIYGENMDLYGDDSPTYLDFFSLSKVH
ncbi:MAG: hypothetical protein K9H64_08270 [Bacteroidales bacterium]|nr:hypothetical protein [Bacteroidales bacterium]MCF8455826.1 hypothetical protein [Bacteroidales bacterium]